ncbi:MAG: cytosine permease [Firmicutes bacterium]|nr:cytosine permease [Bacillota bacterium]
MEKEKMTISVEEFGKMNDYATTRVPENAKMSTYSVTMVIIGLIIALSALYTGAAFAQGLSLKEMLIADFCGNLILCFYAGFMGVIGAREGMSVTMIARHSFGKAGSGLISVIVAVSLGGWYAYQCGFFGNTIFAMFPKAGIITEPVIAGIWGGIMMMLTAYVGSKGLEKLSSFAAPLIFVMSLIGMYIAIRNVGSWQDIAQLSETLKQNGSGTMTISTAIVSVVGAFATGGIIQPDVTRFSKTAKQSLVAAVAGFIVVQFIVILAGYVICVSCANSDIAAAMLQILGIWSLLILIFAQWTTNDNNLYSSSLAVCALFPNLKKKKVVIIIGFIAIAVGATGIVNHFVTFLNILGILVPPVGGIIIADYFVCKKMSYQFGQGTKYGFLSITAVITWIISCIIGYFVSFGVACINSMVIAFVTYLVLEMLFKNSPNKKYIGGFYEEDDYGMTTKC